MLRANYRAPPPKPFVGPASERNQAPPPPLSVGPTIWQRGTFEPAKSALFAGRKVASDSAAGPKRVCAHQWRVKGLCAGELRPPNRIVPLSRLSLGGGGGQAMLARTMVGRPAGQPRVQCTSSSGGRRLCARWAFQIAANALSLARLAPAERLGRLFLPLSLSLLLTRLFHDSPTVKKHQHVHLHTAGRFALGQTSLCPADVAKPALKQTNKRASKGGQLAGWPASQLAGWETRERERERERESKALLPMRMLERANKCRWLQNKLFSACLASGCSWPVLRPASRR